MPFCRLKSSNVTTDDQTSQEKMPDITSYQRNMNEHYSEVSPHTAHNGHRQKLYMHDAGESVGKEEPSYTLGGNADWIAAVENRMKFPQKTEKYHMTQQIHSWAYIQRKPQSERMQAPQCSEQHHLQ